MQACTLIVVVEDDDAIRETLTHLLLFEGYNVKSARNGREALDVLETMTKPCLILLDLTMPVMSGPEFIALAKKSHTIATIPIVIFSAICDSSTSKVMGVEGAIKKPADIDALLKIVRKYCGSPPPHPGSR